MRARSRTRPGGAARLGSRRTPPAAAPGSRAHTASPASDRPRSRAARPASATGTRARAGSRRRRSTRMPPGPPASRRRSRRGRHSCGHRRPGARAWHRPVAAPTGRPFARRNPRRTPRPCACPTRPPARSAGRAAPAAVPPGSQRAGQLHPPELGGDPDREMFESRRAGLLEPPAVRRPCSRGERAQGPRPGERVRDHPPGEAPPRCFQARKAASSRSRTGWSSEASRSRPTRATVRRIWSR